VKFRSADTQWRSEAARRGVNKASVEEARHLLEALIADIKRVEDRDDVWAEAHASLGDLTQDMGGIMQYVEGVPHYQEAFEWLSAAHNGEPVPELFLAIVMRMTQPQGVPPHQSGYGNMADFLPVEMLDKGIAIASADEEKSHLHYLIANKLLDHYGDVGQHPADESSRDPWAHPGRVRGGAPAWQYEFSGGITARSASSPDGAGENFS